MTSDSRPRKRWEVLPAIPRDVQRTLSGYPPLLAQLLYNRGVRSAAGARSFLEPRPSSVDHTLLLPGADRAIARLTEALRRGEMIAIFGDFDADGVTSSAVFFEALSRLGARLVMYFPDRAAEGHGLNAHALSALAQQGAKVVVTADCGVSSVAEATAAAGLGLDLVITDHHAPPPALPQAVAVVDPKRDESPSQLAALASVGVAFKLCEALHVALGRAIDRSLLEFVALGTIADVSPMSGENRALVREGLESLNRTRRPGIKALLEAAGLAPRQVDTEAVGFALGPRVNAPGRIGQAISGFRLLTASSPDEARILAQEIDLLNSERQRLTGETLARAQEIAAVAAPSAPILFAGAPDFPLGIVGLVAGKLTEAYYRPAVVYRKGPAETRASCRSIPEFNIIEALRRCDSLLLRYGGHAQAAGFTIATDKLAELEARLTAIAADQLKGADVQPRIVADAEIPLGRIDGAAIRAMRELAPFGAGNQTPTFLARDIELRDAWTMGDDGRHLALRLREGSMTWSAVAFNAPKVPQPMPDRVDIVFTLGIDRREGRETLRLNVLDLIKGRGPPGTC